MNENVDWSAMSEEDFVALLRQLIEAPEADDDQV